MISLVRERIRNCQGMFSRQRRARVLLIALDSEIYPAMGESHGISVLAGHLESVLSLQLDALKVIDMYALDGQEKDQALYQTVRDFRPTIIGISVPYATYSHLKNLYPKLKNLLKQYGQDVLVIFGGPIPTYLPQMIIQEIDRSAVIVQGEGEEAIVEVIRNWLNRDSLEAVPNVCYSDGGQLKCQERVLVDLSTISRPYRRHISTLAKKKAQIFTESSRGCSWAACTFCPRGLLDMKGTCDEYRRFPIGRLRQDLVTLKDEGIQIITFADEDFLGGELLQRQQLVTSLEELTRTEKLRLCFDVSMRVQSIYCSSWNESEIEQGKGLLKRLKNIGLREVSLGVESGSSTQLKRYGKQHTAGEAAKAVQVLRDLGITVEVGFIMFDPLCNLKEIEENIQFLEDNDLAALVPAWRGVELRLQLGSRYLTMLGQKEKQLGLQLFQRALNPDTLTYPPFYANSEVRLVASEVRRWNSCIRPLYYPLNNLSRYGTGGILEGLVLPVRELIAEMRKTYLERIIELVNMVKSFGYITESFEEQPEHDFQKFSRKILGIFGDYPSIIKNPLVSSVLGLAYLRQ